MGEKKSYFDEQDEGSVDDAVIATEARFDETTTSRTGATALRWVLTLIVFFLFAGMAWLTWSLAPVVVGALASAVLFSCTWCWNGSVRWCCASASSTAWRVPASSS